MKDFNKFILISAVTTDSSQVHVDFRKIALGHILFDVLEFVNDEE